MNKRTFMICMTLVVVGVAATAIAWPHLPERIPLHWNAHGHLDGYGPRWMLLVLGPGLMAAEICIFALLPVFSPRSFETDSFRNTYQLFAIASVVLAGYIQAVVLAVAVTGNGDIVSPALLSGVSLLLVFIGNLMGKVRRNFFIGIRTPWTLASERVWYATHRLAGKTMVATGLVSIAAAVWGGLPGIALWLALIGTGVLVPIVFSFIHYRSLERSGGLGV
jgi:uncharacterized membrane protein